MPATIAIRSIIGLLQGLILSTLYFINESPVQWPATIILPLTIVTLLVPLLIVQSIGNMRIKTMLVWGVTATVILSGIFYYAVFRQALPSQNFNELPGLLFFICIPLFIAHTLVLSSDHDKYLIAQYPTYFDIAWKLGVQIALAVAFTASFWLLLLLGVGLFEIIHLNFFKKIIINSWFAIPATTLAITIALHITDIKVHLIRGIRTLCLVLLSWLLPLITGIVSLFLMSLFFTGLSLLWKTGFASTLLLLAVASLIILINAVYQDGKHQLPTVQRYSATLACCLLIPLMALAMYALNLRVQQYGWSVERIYAAVCILIAASYASGYTLAIFISDSPLKRIETCNLAVACLIVAVFLALLTPLADPARLMVANQLSRLQTGQVIPEKFDFKALRFQGLRFGQSALQNLETTWQGPEADYVHAQAKATLALKIGNDWRNLNADTRRQLIIAHTKDSKLPDSFLKQNWKWRDGSISIPVCLRGYETCQAWMVQEQDKSSIILILDRNGFTGFKQNRQGTWAAIGNWNIPHSCKGKIQNAIQGNFNMVAPSEPTQPDIEIMGWRAPFHPNENTNPCQ